MIEKIDLLNRLTTTYGEDLELINNKINEIVDYLNNQKQSLNSLYGISMKDYIKKEDLREYLVQNEFDTDIYLKDEKSEYLKQFYSGINYTLHLIRAKFCE